MILYRLCPALSAAAADKRMLLRSTLDVPCHGKGAERPSFSGLACCGADAAIAAFCAEVVSHVDRCSWQAF